MGNKTQTPETLIRLVEDLIDSVAIDVANKWTVTYVRNRAKFDAPNRSFSIRDRGEGYFTISYGYAPGLTTTRYYDRTNALRLAKELLARIPGKPEAPTE